MSASSVAFRAVRALLALVVVALGALAVPSVAHAVVPACGPANVTVTRASGPVLYLQTGTLDSAYVMYKIQNATGAGYADLWVKAATFAGPQIGLASSESGLAHLGALAAGASGNAAFYLTAGGATTGAEAQAVDVYTTRPDLASAALCRASFTMTAETDIAAAANKVDSVSSTATAQLGGTVKITVVGNTGTIGAAKLFTATPASYASWPANAYRLTGSKITLSGGNTGVYTDTLFLTGLASTSATDYTAEFTFAVVGTTAGTTAVSPMNHISSGTQVKHTSTTNFSSLPAIPAVVNHTSIAASASPATLAPSGGTATVTVTVTNAGAAASTLDDLVVTLPAGTTYVPGSSTFGGVAITDPSVAGTAATYLAGLTVPANASRTLTLQVTVPGTPGTYTASAVGHIASVAVDTTTGTADSAPASTGILVPGPSPTVTGLSPTTGAAAGGTSVAVTGTDLSGATAVSFGGTPAASFTVNGPTSITATSPPGSGAVDVTVTTPSGTSATSAQDVYTYGAPPVAAPAPSNLTSSGTGTAPQTGTVTIPAGGGATLLDTGTPTATVTVVGQGTYTISGATITFTPALGYTGTATPVTYRVTDQYQQTGTATYTPTVTPPAAPAPSNLTSSGAGTTPQTGTVTIPAGGGATLLDTGTPTSTVTVVGQGTYTISGATITFTPVVAYAGTATPVTYRVTDAYAQTGTATYTPTVTAAPVPPAPSNLTSSGTGTAPQTATVTIPASGSATLLDTGTPTGTVTVVGQGTYTISGATITFTPVLGHVGAATAVTYRVTDAASQTGTATYTPTVAAPAAPVPGALTSTANAPDEQAVTVTIPAGGGATLLNAGAPAVTVTTAAGEYAIAGTTITFNPAAGYSGSTSAVTYRITDAYGQTGTATYTPTVIAPAAPAPGTVTSTGAGTAPQTATVTVPPGGSATLLRPDGIPAGTVGTAGGTYTISGGSITFTPVLGYRGATSTVTYRITDGFGQTGTAVYAPTVTAPTGPSAAPLTSSGRGTDAQAVTVAAPAGGQVRLLDAGAPATTLTVAGKGTFAVTATGLGFTAVVGFVGTASTGYRSSDAYGQHADATYTATVRLPPPPAAPARTSSGVGTVPQSATLPVPAGGSIALLDAGGNPVTTLTITGKGTYTLSTAPVAEFARTFAFTAAGPASGRPEAGPVTASAGGATISFVAVLGYTGTAPPVNYQITDAYGQTATATYTPTVVLPSLPSPAPQTSVGQQTDPQHVTLPVPAGGTIALLDPDGNPVTTLTIAGQGTYTLDPATGLLVFTPLPAFTGSPDPVVYRVTDAYGQTATATYTPAVTGTGHLPVTGGVPGRIALTGLLAVVFGALVRRMSARPA